MARANWRWLGAIRRALARSSCTSAARLDAIKTNATAIYNPVSAVEEAEVAAVKDSAGYYSSKEEAEEEEEVGVVYKETFSREELAAITIQAHFRAHLARRAFRALKSLVRLQAVVRGACVRRQARIAIHCMQALVRLQVRVRARQLIAERSGVRRVDN